MKSTKPSSARRLLARLSRTALVATFVAACGGDEGDIDPDDVWIPSPGEADAAVMAWRAAPIKECSLHAIFPELPPGQERDPGRGVSVAAVRTAADPNLVWTVGDRQLLVASFPALDDDDRTYTQKVQRSRTGEGTFVAELQYEGGRCKVSVGGTVVFDEELRKVTISGVRGDTAGGSARVKVIAPGAEPADIGPLAAGAHLVDFAGIFGAISDALLPVALREPGALGDLLAPDLGIPPELARALIEPGSSLFYKDLLLPKAIALPPIGAAHDRGKLVSTAIVTAAELAALRQAAELRLVWAYAGSNANGVDSDRTTQFEVVLGHTGDLQYKLLSIQPVGSEAKSDERAASCVAARVERLQTYASAVPAGSYAYDVEPCANLTRDLVRAVASSASTTSMVLTLLHDDVRASAPPRPGSLAPSDGGPTYELGSWDDFYEELLVSLESQERLGLVTAPSRIISGFLASVAALDAHALKPASRRALVAAAASRAMDAAGGRAYAELDYRPLTAAHAARIAGALRTDDLSDALAGEVSGLVRGDALDAIDHNAALACLGGTTLDPVRATLTTLAQREDDLDEPRKVWLTNAIATLLAWDDEVDDVLWPATYCKPAFVTWAQGELAAPRPVCVYDGVTFDRSDFCVAP